MYNKSYEVSASITSLIIFFSSSYILAKSHNYLLLFIILSAFFSFLTRAYRIWCREYIMLHPLVYLDIIFAITAFITYLIFPCIPSLYYAIIWAFFFMIIAALMSWGIFSVNLVEESFIFQLLGHLIIAFSLLYYIFFDL
jgi:hypothetical protein